MLHRSCDAAARALTWLIAFMFATPFSNESFGRCYRCLAPCFQGFQTQSNLPVIPRSTYFSEQPSVDAFSWACKPALLLWQFCVPPSRFPCYSRASAYHETQATCTRSLWRTSWKTSTAPGHMFMSTGALSKSKSTLGEREVQMAAAPDIVSNARTPATGKSNQTLFCS